MTTAMAARFERRNHGRNHSYYLDGVRLRGVTTTLNLGKPKPALVNWSADAVASAAVDRWDELAELPISERLKVLKAAPNETRDKAALRGQDIHTLAWRMVNHEAVEVPEAYVGPVEAAARFMDAHALEAVIRERPVVNVTHRWAGTVDLLCGIRGTLWLLDWKTGKGVYDESALQLAAYAHAEYWQHEDGHLAEWPTPERCGVVHLTSDSAELYEVDAGDEAYRVFRYVSEVADWAERVSAAFKDGRSWPIGPALDLAAEEGAA